MSLRRALDRLEAVTPAARLSESTLIILPAALRVAVRGVGDGYGRVKDSPAWAACVAPFPVHLAGTALQTEQERRLDALIPVVRDVAGDEGLKLFLL